MSSLLDEQSKKRGLSRGAQIKTSSSVDLASLKVESNNNWNEPNVTNKVTEAVNIRVDNHIRNMVTALSIIGYGDTQKEVTLNVLNHFIEELEPEVLKRYEDLVNIYEEKDVAKWRKNQLKKNEEKK